LKEIKKKKGETIREWDRRAPMKMEGEKKKRN